MYHQLSKQRETRDKGNDSFIAVIDYREGEGGGLIGIEKNRQPGANFNGIEVVRLLGNT